MSGVEVVVQPITALPTPSAAAIEAWLQAALEGHSCGGELTVRLVDEEESRELNAQFRGRAAPTNVLAFPFEAPPGLECDPGILGDIVICASVVAREAREQGKAEEHHWAHLVIHGALHLVGYDHEQDEAAERMEACERRLLAAMGIPDPYG